MPVKWDLSDSYLSQMLQAMIDIIAANSDCTLCLYQNDYTPIPGTVLGDFVEATFPSYSNLPIDASLWGAVSVTSNVASSTSGSALIFTGGAGTWTPQTIYGYFVLDWGLNYFWAERFNNPIDMSPLGQITIIPRLRHETVPN